MNYTSDLQILYTVANRLNGFLSGELKNDHYRKGETLWRTTFRFLDGCKADIKIILAGPTDLPYIVASLSSGQVFRVANTTVENIYEWTVGVNTYTVTIQKVDLAGTVV